MIAMRWILCKLLFLRNNLFIAIGLWAATCVCASAYGASGEEIYKAKCSSCHDSGAGQAPRVGVRADWSAREVRGRNAMLESAIKGIPSTAMAAKGGYAELSDAEVKQTVDYMLERVGFREAVAVPRAASPSPQPAVSSGGGLSVDDASLVNRVAEALKKALAPDARIEHYAGESTVRGINIRVGARDGVVTLSGAVEKSDLIPRADAIATSIAGVRRVESKLVAAGMFDFD
jgi:cytochrome c5